MEAFGGTGRGGSFLKQIKNEQCVSVAETEGPQGFLNASGALGETLL